VVSASREIVREIDPDVPARFGTFAQVFSSSLSARQFNLTLLVAFAATALLLAVAGIYGVMAYTVSRRTREIGVRMALGAAAGDVLRLVLGQGLWTTVIGVALGMAGSFALSRTMHSLLFEVNAADPVTLVGSALLLAGVSLLACWIPARRAMHVDPWWRCATSEFQNFLAWLFEVKSRAAEDVMRQLQAWLLRLRGLFRKDQRDASSRQNWKATFRCTSRTTCVRA